MRKSETHSRNKEIMPHSIGTGRSAGSRFLESAIAIYVGRHNECIIEHFERQDNISHVFDSDYGDQAMRFGHGAIGVQAERQECIVSNAASTPSRVEASHRGKQGARGKAFEVRGRAMTCKRGST